jgi:hypothetical protein
VPASEFVDQIGGEVEESLAPFRYDPAQLLVSRCVHPEFEQEGRPLRLLLAGSGHRLRDGMVGVLQSLFTEDDCRQFAGSPFLVSIKNGQKEFVFPAEVRVHRTLRITGRFSDFVQTCAMKAAFKKHLSCRSHETRAGLPFPFGVCQSFRHLHTDGI